MSTPTTLINPYCTLRAAQIEAGNDSADAAVELIPEINKASRWLDEHCNRDFLFHDNAFTPLAVDESWCAGNTIYLPWPIITLTEVRIGGVVFPATSYRFSRRPGSATTKIERNGPWIEDLSTATALNGEKGLIMSPQIELFGTFGFAPANDKPTETPSPDLPATIGQACAAIAAIRSGQVRREITTADGGRESFTVRSIPKSVLESIAAYRIPVV